MGENGSFRFIGQPPSATTTPPSLSTVATGTVGGGRILGEAGRNGDLVEGSGNIQGSNVAGVGNSGNV